MTERAPIAADHLDRAPLERTDMNDYDPLFSHATETTDASDPQTTATTDLFFSADAQNQATARHIGE